jgi:hypothetical protein
MTFDRSPADETVENVGPAQLISARAPARTSSSESGASRLAVRYSIGAGCSAIAAASLEASLPMATGVCPRRTSSASTKRAV